MTFTLEAAVKAVDLNAKRKAYLSLSELIKGCSVHSEFKVDMAGRSLYIKKHEVASILTTRITDLTDALKQLGVEELRQLEE